MLEVEPLFVLFLDEFLQVVSSVHTPSAGLSVTVHTSTSDCPFFSQVSVTIVDGQTLVIEHVS